MADFLTAYSITQPEKLAVVDDRPDGTVHSLTYAQLNERANQFVLEAYRGGSPKGDGVHLLGPLAGKVVRISPPLVITPTEARDATPVLENIAARERSDGADRTDGADGSARSVILNS